MREYFKEHYRRVKYVLISTIDSQTGDEVSDDKKEEAKKTAEEVLEKAQNGEDFDTLISIIRRIPQMIPMKTDIFSPITKQA